jgi:hypothetical protein
MADTWRAIPSKPCGVALWLVAALALYCILAIASPAYAGDYQVSFTEGQAPSSTGGASDLQINRDFACNADGSSSGELFINPQCDATAGLFGIFANVVCRVESIFSTMLGFVYCSIQSAVLKPLLAMLTLYVTIYGAMVILGMVQNTFKEAAIRIGKIGLVSAVALNAHVAIGVGYTFFISLTQTTMDVIFQVFTPDQIAADTGLSKLIEAGFVSSPSAADETKRLYTGSDWMLSLEYTFHRIIGFFVSGGIGFIMVMVCLLIFAPPLFFMLAYLMLATIKALASAVVGYLLALLGITFLFALSPIFICFALFRVTSAWFDAWVRNLFSYTLQIMIIFVFLMIMIMIDIVTFFQQIGGMFNTYMYVAQFGWIMWPLTIFTLCEPLRNDNGELLYFKFTPDGEWSSEHGTAYEGFPRCTPPYEVDLVLSGEQQLPGLTAENMEVIREALDGLTEEELNELSIENMPSSLEFVYQMVAKANADLIMPITEVFQNTDLVGFLLTRFLIVIILTYLLERFLKEVPHLAGQLAGTSFQGRLGGGESKGEQAGVQSSDAFSSIDTGFAKFKQAYYGSAQDYYTKGFVFKAPLRLARGVMAGLGGARDTMVRQSVARGAQLGLSKDLRSQLSIGSDLLQSRSEGDFSTTRGGIGSHTGGRGGGYHPTVGSPRPSRRGT